MKVSLNWPNDTADMVFNSEAATIYEYIQDHGNNCNSTLKAALKNEDIDQEKYDKLHERVMADMRLAGEIRFSLNTVDNRLRRSRQGRFEYRRFASEMKSKGHEDNLALLLKVLEDSGGLVYPEPIFEFVESLAADINLSLNYRIELIETWDEILRILREVMVEHLIRLSHQITEVALQLQDSDTIQMIRELFSQLDLKVPLPSKAPPSREDPLSMKTRLDEDVQEVDQSKDHIEQLDQQRSDLQRVKKKLVQKMEETEQKANQPGRSSSSSSSGRSSFRGMHSRRERRRR